jgi:hypothetical protein
MLSHLKDPPKLLFKTAVGQGPTTCPLTTQLLPRHTAIACFLAAAHQTMLESLQEACKEKGLNGPQLLEYWHELMEPTGVRDRREAFFYKSGRTSRFSQSFHFISAERS